MYNIDFSIQIRDLLPAKPDLRKPKMRAWLESLLHPVMLLYAEFIAYRNEKLYEARVTGQVNSLEWMLNDKFYNDGNLRNIYIEDNTVSDEDIYIFNTDEAETETFIFNASESDEEDIFIFNSEEGTGGPSFIVWVPVALSFDMNYMISEINKFKLAGPSYTIKTY